MKIDLIFNPSKQLYEHLWFKFVKFNYLKFSTTFSNLKLETTTAVYLEYYQRRKVAGLVVTTPSDYRYTAAITRFCFVFFFGLTQ